MARIGSTAGKIGKGKVKYGADVQACMQTLRHTWYVLVQGYSTS